MPWPHPKIISTNIKFQCTPNWLVSIHRGRRTLKESSRRRCRSEEHFYLIQITHQLEDLSRAQPTADARCIWLWGPSQASRRSPTNQLMQDMQTLSLVSHESLLQLHRLSNPSSLVLLTNLCTDISWVFSTATIFHLLWIWSGVKCFTVCLYLSYSHYHTYKYN